MFHRSIISTSHSAGKEFNVSVIYLNSDSHTHTVVPFRVILGCLQIAPGSNSSCQFSGWVLGGVWFVSYKVLPSTAQSFKKHWQHPRYPKSFWNVCFICLDCFFILILSSVSFALQIIKIFLGLFTPKILSTAVNKAVFYC